MCVSLTQALTCGEKCISNLTAERSSLGKSTGYDRHYGSHLNEREELSRAKNVRDDVRMRANNLTSGCPGEKHTDGTKTEYRCN